MILVLLAGVIAQNALHLVGALIATGGIMHLMEIVMFNFFIYYCLPRKKALVTVMSLIAKNACGLVHSLFNIF